jgi:5-methylcytosine-specific restriction endonuclease McrA
MLFTEQFDQRVKELYSSQQALVRQKKWKSGKRQGMTRVPAQLLPFTRDQLRMVLWTFCGIQAVPCPYCGVPVDILSLTLDHVIPRGLGGSLGLENIKPCCKRCNQLKDKLMPDEFTELLGFLNRSSTHMRNNLESRLLGSLRKIDFSRKKKSDQEFIPPPREQQKTLMVPDQNGDPTF